MTKMAKLKSSSPRRGARFFAFKRSFLSFPYALFLLLFVLLPILIIVLYAFTETVYAPDGTESLTFSWNGLLRLLHLDDEGSTSSSSPSSWAS